MDDDDGPGLGTIVLVGVAGVVVALMVLGWIVGTVLALVRTVAVVVLAVAVVVWIARGRINR